MNKDTRKLYDPQEEIVNIEELKSRIQPTEDEDDFELRRDIVPKGKIELFTIAKTSHKYNLDDSLLMPTTATLLSGKKFRDNYRKQLNKVIWSPDNVDNINALIEVSVLWSYITIDQYPLTLHISGYKKKRKEIIEVLNDFFNYNKTIIANIYRMVRDQMDSSIETLGKQEG